MKKNNIFLLLLIIVIAVIIVIVVYKLVLDNSGKINQGNFRINDFVVENYATVDEIQNASEQATDLTSMTFNLSQTNTISLLIAKNSEVDLTKAYIDNIVISDPAKKGKLGITETEKLSVDELSTSIQRLDLNPIKQEDGQYLIKIYVNNMNLAEGVRLPENTNVIKYDGTMFDLVGIKNDELKFNVEFDLNVEDSMGKLNKSKIKITIPSDNFVKEGFTINREDISNISFVVAK